MKRILQMSSLLGVLIAALFLSSQPSIQALSQVDLQGVLYQWLIPIFLCLQVFLAIKWRIPASAVAISWLVLASMVYFLDPTALVNELIDMSLLNVGAASVGALVGQWFFEREQLRLVPKQAVMIFIPVVLSVLSWLAVTFIEYVLAENGLSIIQIMWVLLAITLVIIGIVNRHFGVPFVWQCVSLIIAVVGLWVIQASANLEFTNVHRIYSYYFVIHSVGYALGAIPVSNIKNRLK